jgi:hypothetical protein
MSDVDPAPDGAKIVADIKARYAEEQKKRGYESAFGEQAKKSKQANPKVEKPAEEPKVNAGKAKPGPKDGDEEPASVKALGVEEAKRRQRIRRLKLEEINRSHAVIKALGGKCVVVTEHNSGFVFQSKQAFEQWLSNAFVPSLKKFDESEAVGPWWWRHPKRRQYDGVIFKPLAEPVVRSADGRLLLNTYLNWGVQPKEGDWSLIRRHITEVLANNVKEAEEYIVRWIAWAIQHPDRTADVALVLIGEKGTGKGTLARVLEKIFGNHSFQASSLEHVVGRFNAHKEDCILFVADEAYWPGHKSAAGELQRMITEPTLPIERKGFDVYEAPNYIHMLMLAEPGWVAPAGKFERRYAVFDVSEGRMGDFEYFKALHGQIEGGGAAAMLHELRGMELGDWHPRQICRTDALRRQQEMSLLPLDQWMLGLLVDGELPDTQPTALLEDLQRKVPRARDLGKMKLSTYLTEQWGCTKHGGDERGYNFPPLAEMRSIWEKRFGKREWSSPEAEWSVKPSVLYWKM